MAGFQFPLAVTGSCNRPQPAREYFKTKGLFVQHCGPESIGLGIYEKLNFASTKSN